MKILVISNLYPSLKTPYYGSFVKNFMDQIKSDSRITKVNGVFLKGFHKNYLTKLFLYILFYLRIFYYLLFYNYDLIYVHLITHSTIPISIVSLVKKLNLIFNIHGEDILVSTKRSKLLLKLAIPTVCKAKHIVVPSKFFKKITESKISCLKKDKIIISPSAGIKKDFYNENKINMDKTSITLGFVSRIDRGKGWKTYIKAIELLNKKGIFINAIIAGDGPEKKELLYELKSRKLDNIKYYGGIPHNNLPDFYKKIDCFIFPTTLNESLGLVGLEAMASGVPVIGSKIGGLQEYINDNKNGMFFEPNNENDLAKKIIDYINLPIENKIELSKNAYNTAIKFEESKISKELFDIILK